MARWRDLSAAAPRSATYAATVLGGVATLGFVWVGDPDDGREHARVARGARSAARAARGGAVLPRPPAPRGQHRGPRAASLLEGPLLPRAARRAIEVLLAHDPSVAASLQAYGGAIAEVPDDATAFSQRGTAFEYVGAARWTDPAEDEYRIATARESAAGLEPFASGAYVNVLGDEGAAGVRRAYSAREAGQAHRAQGRRRPGQRLPPEPEHPPEHPSRPGRTSARCYVARMKAVVYDRYGRPDVLRIEDVPMPTPGAGQVLVKVAATSINLSDWEGLRGSPVLRAYRRPASRRLAGRSARTSPAWSKRSAPASRGSSPATRCTATTSR